MQQPIRCQQGGLGQAVLVRGILEYFGDSEGFAVSAPLPVCKVQWTSEPALRRICWHEMTKESTLNIRDLLPEML